MNGAESLLRTAVAAGVDICFANPGTTEMPLVVALDSVSGVRAVLCLFEGVCTGAADGYGRMAGKPALTLLHLGPGFANGIANLHNARRARSPVVNLIGDQATWHLAADAPLTSDIVSLARPVSNWVRTSRSAEELGGDLAEAIAAASTQPGQVASLIVPHDCQLDPATGPAPPLAPPAPTSVDQDTIRRCAELLRKSAPAALFLGGSALGERGLRVAARIAEATGCKLLCETFPARLERGRGIPAPQRFPYFPDQGLAALANFQAIVVAGAKEPVSFFGYPGLPSRLISPEQKSVVLGASADVTTVLESLADEIGASQDPRGAAPPLPDRPTGSLTLERLAAAVASAQPEGAIIVDEGNTSSAAYYSMSAGAPYHSYLTLTGGSIGQGMPCATGAALACPGRKVINLQADGAGMYTLQALWTQARESLDITTIVCANRSYRVLGIELARAGLKELGPQTRSLIDLSNPQLDWVQLAQGMGVPAVRVETAEDLTRQLERALAETGPHLIEAVL